jgi:hypothetical protein
VKIYKLSAAILVLSIIMMRLVNTGALDARPPQVMIETKIATIDVDHSRELGVDFAFAQRIEEGQVVLDASIVARGMGNDLQRWTPVKTYIETDSGTILPDLTKPIQLPLTARDLSLTADLLASISRRYSEHAVITEASPGKFCPVRVLPESEEETLDVSGLLLGKPGATLRGIKSVFRLSDLPLINVLFKADIKHDVRPNIITILVPLKIVEFEVEGDDAFRDAANRAKDAYSTKKGRSAKTYVNPGTYFPQLGDGTSMVNPAPEIQSDTHDQQTDGSTCSGD